MGMRSSLFEPRTPRTSRPRSLPRFLALLALLISSPADAQLILNEVVASNRSGLRDERGNRPDWIELHNPTSRTVPLARWSLSDNPRRPTQWTFRSGEIEPGGYRVVFASGADRQPQAQPPLDPAGVPGLVLRLRAAGIDRLDAAQVRTAGGQVWVRRWTDLSRKTGDAAEPNPAAQPRLITVDGQPAVRFDGVDDRLLLPRSPGTNSFTLLAVVRPRTGHEIDAESASGVEGVSGQRWVFGAAHGGDLGAGAGLSVGTNGASLYEHGSAYMPARLVAEADLGHRPVLLSMVYSNRQPSLAVNGVPFGSGTGASSRDPVTAPVEIGAGAYGAFDGDLLEVIGFNRALDRSEREAIESHLAAVHGATLTQVHHTSFEIDADGETVQLTTPEGLVADRIVLSSLPIDVSLGRPADGGAGLKYFAKPTPGGPNNTPSASAVLGPVAFSHPAGFHTNAFLLTLSNGSTGPGIEIRYTLDGSEPLPGSPLYTRPLSITNRAGVPNQLSLVPTAPGWSAPAGPVFKGTVVRARAFRADALPSAIATTTFFVHPKGRDRYPLPVVALSTDPRNLFHPKTGIYVPGEAPGGNYAQSGDAWERPVHVEFFETNGVVGLSQEAGLRIHGNTSFNFPLKALRLHARNQGGTGPFRTRFFPEHPYQSFDRLLLRPSGHDYSLTMMRDGLMQTLVEELGLDQQAYRPAIVFIDGEFWGIHNLQEAFEKRYFPRHHPEVDPDALDYLEGYPPGTFAYEGDSSFFDRFFQSLAALPLETEEGFAAVPRHMEVANFRDYKLTEVFYYRWDIGNHRLWRPRTPDGRLRWILFDCDVGFGGFWSEPQPWSFDMLSAVIDPTGVLHGHNNEVTTHLLRQLLRNPGFRRDFINRAADLLNTTWATPRVLGVIDRMAAEISPAMVEHISRWRAPSSFSEWNRQVELLRTFARLRPDQLRRHLRQRFGLRGNVRLRLSSWPAEAGSVNLNSLGPLTVTDPATEWSGIYFRDNPIRLEAQAKPGWRFAGWIGLPGATTPTIQFTLNQDFTTAPLFLPDNPLRLTLSRNPGLSPNPNGTGGQEASPGALQLRILGPPGATVIVESSRDLRQWQESSRHLLGIEGSAARDLTPGDGPDFLRARIGTPPTGR